MVFFCYKAKAQNITTIAGGGSSSSTGVPATTVTINDPCGGTFDIYGNFYFADGLSGQRIWKIDTNCVIWTVAGNGSGGYSGEGLPATASMLNYPVGVAINRHNHMFICEAQNNMIRRVDMLSGLMYTYAGNDSVHGYAGDNGPASAALLYDPQDICVDKYGNLLIAAGYNNAIRKIDTNGIITTIAGNGTYGSDGDGGPATNAHIGFSGGIITDRIGNIYYCSNNEDKVRKIDTNGIITTFAGTGSITYTGDGIPATNAHIAPIRLGCDAYNNVFIADRYHNRVFKVDTFGIIHCVAGTGVTGFSGDGFPATSAEFYGPGSAIIDPCNNLYISDIGNNRIRKVTFDSTCRIATLKTTNIVESKDIKLYPNPANHTLSISYSEAISSVVVYDMVGKIVIDNKYNSINSVDIDVRRLKRGVYVVRVNGGEVRRFVVSEP